MKIIRFGLIGPGRIAHHFAQSISRVDGAELATVASRDFGRAQEFAAQYGARATESYEALAKDKNIDAVYISTPHNFHCEQAIMCLNAGKAVLCEKPISPNAGQVEAMIAAAQKRGAYLMEAMWTRFLPAVIQAKRWIDEGRIGIPRVIEASFSYNSPEDPASRLYDPALAGGALLDVGVYPISFAAYMLGELPDKHSSIANKASTGVDSQAVMALGFPSGAMAALSCGASVTMSGDARVFGTEGSIYLPLFWRGEHAILTRVDGTTKEAHHPIVGKDFSYEITAMCDDLRAGRIESAIMPQEESLAIIRLCDELRASWGVSYPFDTQASR